MTLHGGATDYVKGSRNLLGPKIATQSGKLEGPAGNARDLVPKHQETCPAQEHKEPHSFK